ncbi:MAG TPA: YigZ family protein, partial [Erysipelothrix sp.]
VEQHIKKSKFITYLAPVKTEDEAKDFLAWVKKEHHKATHHCSAYICDDIERSNDDGEPASSAGLPMLQTLQGSNMNYVIAVVVRYYGGIKLGVGGLIRAYGSSVQQALDAAIILEPLLVETYEVAFPYEFINDIEVHFENNATIVDRNYDSLVRYTVDIIDKKILEPLSDITRGQSQIEKIKESIKHVRK